MPLWYHKSDACWYIAENGGNICSVKTYAYTTGELGTAVSEKAYTYGNTEWKDLLTNYNGVDITYDTIGNPLNWVNGEQLDWSGGRQLTGIVKGNDTISYTYNDNGIRTSKTVNGVRTDYYLSGTAIIMQKTGDNVIWYTYDENGLKTGFTYNGTAYYYVYNLQGDVIALLNSAGETVARYDYDPWGKVIAITDGNGVDVSSNATHIANVNPIKYRGYYYDTETGLYYINSRYYDADVCRFVSADTHELITASLNALTDKNLFAYCDNNPIIRVDTGGEFWNVIIGAAVGAVAGVAGQLVSDIITTGLNRKVTLSSWQSYVGAAVGGAVGGAILAGTGNAGLANAATGFVTTGVSMTLEKITGDSDASWAEIGINAVVDGAVSYGMGQIPEIKFSKVTKGRNSMKAVYKSGLTKLRNGTAKHMSAKVMGKGVPASIVGGIYMDVYYGKKQHSYKYIRQRFAQ